LNDPTVHFDENQRRLLINYRQPFLMYAVYLLNVKHEPTEAVKVLDRMETVMPRKVVEMDYRFKSDLMRMYLSAGDSTRAREFAGEIVGELQGAATSVVTEPLGQWNPLLILIESYDLVGQYDNAMKILDRIGTQYAGTPGLPQFVQSRRAELLAKKR
jgi:hypothetical protein